MNKTKVETALLNIKENQYARWSYANRARNSNTKLGSNRINERFVKPLIEPKFTVPAKAKIFAIGSCFAREIEISLHKKGKNVVSLLFPLATNGRDRPRLEKIKQFKDIHRSELLNRYSMPSMYQEIKNLADQGSFLDYRLIQETAENNYIDCHYTPATGELSLENAKSQREILTSSLSDAFKEADVFILTFGLNEFWRDLETDLIFNTIPSLQFVRNNKDRFVYQEGPLAELIEYGEKTVETITKSNCNAKIIITVSPVPLEYTFMSKDIVMQNLKAKNALHAVANHLADINKNVDYFPSYEMVTMSKESIVWKEDRRHIQFDFVNKIMDYALEKYFID